MHLKLTDLEMRASLQKLYYSSTVIKFMLWIPSSPLLFCLGVFANFGYDRDLFQSFPFIQEGREENPDPPKNPLHQLYIIYLFWVNWWHSHSKWRVLQKWALELQHRNCLLCKPAWCWVVRGLHRVRVWGPCLKGRELDSQESNSFWTCDILKTNKWHRI